LKPTGIFYEVPDFGAKIAENAARVSGLFHIFLHGATGTISADIMESAARVVLWFLKESMRVFGLLEQTAEEKDAWTLLQWLIDRGYQDKEISLSNLLRYGPGRLRKKRLRDGAVQLLRNNFWLIGFNDSKTTCRLHPEAGRCFDGLS
jgi:putative DNA primase/helicase